MQTFICPACSLVFVPRFWASDGCSHSPFAPAVQWAAPTDYWPVCAGSAPQRAGTAVYCQPGTLGTATHTIYITLIHTLIQIHTQNLTHTPKHTRTQSGANPKSCGLWLPLHNTACCPPFLVKGT
jgi:hypothetical protein